MFPKPSRYTGTENLKDLYDIAFRDFGTMCLWNIKRFENPTDEMVLGLAKTLKREGDREAWVLANKIESQYNAINENSKKSS